MTQDLIDDFLKHYEREYDYFCRLAQLTGRLCQSWLHKNAIRGIVTSRGKSPESLRDKIYHRAHWKSYQTFDDIYEDIVDLAGVRIALYFPNNMVDVDSIFRKNLKIHRVVNFPKDKPDKLVKFKHGFKRRHLGYVARHYRVDLSLAHLEADQLRFAKGGVEIQVASVLMHAWSEVEHDLVYKSGAGDLSVRELEVLDEINGIVLQGEEALLNLWRAGDYRLATPQNKIKNKYELSALLHSYLASLPNPEHWDVNAGEVEDLMEHLRRFSMATTRKLQGLFDQIPHRSEETSLCRVLMGIELSSSSK